MKKVRVCCSKSCDSFGAKRIMEKISKETGLKPGEKNDSIDLDFCGCLGYCSKSPNIEIDETNIVFSAEEESVMKEIESGGEDMSGQEIEVDSHKSLEDDELFLKSI